LIKAGALLGLAGFHSVSSQVWVADSTTRLPSRNLPSVQGAYGHGVIRDSVTTEQGATIFGSMMLS
jgi:hypothetical protein